MKATDRPYQVQDHSRSNYEGIAKDNLASAEELSASELSVDIGHNSIPTEGLKEGMPFRRSNEFMTIPIQPNGDDCA